jgi:flagellar motor switch protein FliN/FliY
MTDAVVYEQLDHDADTAGAGSDPDLRRLSEVPMELSVEIGRTRMTVGETLQLRAGSIVTLERLAGEPVDLLVNGTPIARGEVVIIDEEFGLRVTEIVEGELTAANLGEQPAAEAEESSLPVGGQVDPALQE